MEEVSEEASADGDHGLGVLRVLAVLARAEVVHLIRVAYLTIAGCVNSATFPSKAAVTAQLTQPLIDDKRRHRFMIIARY